MISIKLVGNKIYLTYNNRKHKVDTLHDAFLLAMLLRKVVKDNEIE